MTLKMEVQVRVRNTKKEIGLKIKVIPGMTKVFPQIKIRKKRVMYQKKIQIKRTQQGKIRQIRMLQRKTHLIRIQKKIILLYQIKIQPMKKMTKRKSFSEK